MNFNTTHFVHYVRSPERPRINAQGKVVYQSARPYAVIVAVKDGDKIRYGWALADREDRNRFSKKRGREIALQRANSPQHNFECVPHSLVSEASRLQMSDDYYQWRNKNV